MSDDLKKKMKALKKGMQNRDYEVGYGKPPSSKRFTKGESGNPSGRPKGAKNRKPALNEDRLRNIILEEAYRHIKVKDGTKEVNIPMVQAITRSMYVSAARGNPRAQKVSIDLINNAEAKNKTEYEEFVRVAMEYKSHFEDEIERCKLAGIDPPQPIPHPDDIKIDFKTGKVQITGPLTKEEKQKWDRVRARKKEAQTAIKEYEKDLRARKNKKSRSFIEKLIETERQFLETASKIIPD